MTTPARLAAALACATALLSAAPAPAVASGTGTDARPKVCLVLSGGGARGAAHIGVLQVLEDLRVPIDCIVGTSMGSIVGAAYATGMSPAEIETTVRDADWDTLLSDAPSRADRSVYSKERERARVGSTEVGLRRTGLVLPQGVLVGNQLQFFLQRVVGRARTDVFDELPVRYRAIATDFETGGMVVMDRGDLATAIRASMSVPGAFAPVERDGRLLVDGGLVRNLPVDVARSLGAEVVIAVNLGTSLLPRSELTSIVAAAEQTLNILTEQNVRTSLGELGPRDVLIAPDLGDIGAGDFRRSGDAVPAGVAAAWRAEERLRALAVDDAEYIRWLAAQRRPAVPDAVDRLRVDASGLKHVNPASVEATFAGVATGGDLARAVNSLFGTDDFERIDAVRSEGADGTTLTLRPVEKSWGPNYLRAGLGMSSDLSGTSDFTVYLDTRATWLNRRGLEWRNRGSVGQLNSLESELRQPLDSAREWYVAPRFEFRLRERDYFLDDDAIATYRSRRTGVALDLGRRFGNFGEAAIGVAVASASDTRRTGQRLIEDRRGRVAAVGGTFVHDRLDSLDFPQSGQLVQADARFARRFAGGGARYDRVGVSVQQAFGSGPASLLLGLRHGNAFGSDLPLYDAFAAGGFLNLSGWQPDEILASRLTIAQAVYRHRVAGGSGLLPGLYLGGSLEGADVGRRLNGEPELTTLGGSLFLSAESLLGPFYLGAGYSEGGRLSLYLYVGRP